MDSSTETTELNDDKISFEKLTPTSLTAKEMEGYKEALDFAFNEDDLLNIAITGPYASGKSSVIKTYEENSPELDGIHISLSYFSPTLKSKIQCEKNKNESAFDDELMLERKIINQLIHQIDPDKIPATDFKVRSESKIGFKIGWSIIISLIIFCFIYMNDKWFSILLYQYPIATPILIAVSFIFIAIVTFMVIELQSGNNLVRKLKIFENEIDISASSCDVSYFDKYLNEIIYILDKSKLDFIVFEDIDRYDDNLILNKLRELNYTYNKKQSKNKPKKIKFLYLIKDEIFESKERTKFFDYILPIVPIMDNSNSLGKMEAIFKDKNILGDFSSTFLDTLSLYLDDIRLIKNVCNEYIIYKSKLAHDASWFKNEKLLAIIVYKNIFPADYSLTRLGLGQGVVHRIIDSLLKQKAVIFEIRINDIEQKIEQLNNDIKRLDDTHLKNLDELDALYVNFTNGDIHKTILSISNRDVRSKNRTELVQLLKQNDYNAQTFGRGTLNFEQNFAKLKDNQDYLERKNIIELNKDKNQSKLSKEIKKLEKEKSLLIIPKKISEIIQIYQQSGVDLNLILQEHIEIENNKLIRKKHQEEYNKLSSSCYFPLLKVLIIQGYIDENYSDYTTFFDENGLSQNDTLFLRNINERINTDWELELKKIDIVLKKLTNEAANDFTESTILNYSLLDYILATNQLEVLTQFINSLRSLNKTDFIDSYLSRSYSLLENKADYYTQKHLCLFIKELNIGSPNIWNEIASFDQRLYLYLSFIYNQDLILNRMNDDEILKQFIDNSPNFLLLDDEWIDVFKLIDNKKNLNKISDAFSKLKIEFLHIDNATPQLLSIIESINAYVLNSSNVEYILENKYHLKDINSHIIQTLLGLKDDAPVKIYFKNNPEDLLSSVTQPSLARFDDNEETVIYILNNEDISLSVKLSYIDRLSTTITELNRITDKDVWNKLLENQRIKYSADNITFYFFNYELAQLDIEDEDNESDIQYEEREINKQLTNFINNNAQNISSSEANLNQLISDDGDEDLFFDAVIASSDVENSKYIMLISWFNNKTYDNFTFKHIEPEKISILVQHQVIKLGDKQKLNFLRDKYPNNILELIKLNFDDYIKKVQNNSSLIKHSEIIELLSENLNIEQMYSLLSLTKEPISIKNRDYSEDIQKHVLEYNFDVNDLAYITSDFYYNSAVNDIKTKVKELVLKHKTQTLNIDKICYELLTELFAFEDFTLEEKYILLSNQISHLSANQTYHCFQILENEPTNVEQFSRLFILKKPSFTYTPLNEKIMVKLKNKWKFFFRINEERIVAQGRKLVKK